MKTSVADHPSGDMLSTLVAHGIEYRSHIDADVSTLVTPSVIEFHAQGANALSIFVQPASPPSDRVRRDPPTRSFIASGPWIGALLEMESDGVDPCYRALHGALSGDIDIPDIRIFSGVAAVERDVGRPKIEFVIPHMGSYAHLEVCLSSVRSQSMDCTASVCLDETSDWRPACAEERIRLYRADNPPVGPYAIRQFLTMNSSANYFAFQDSDDFSVRSRLTELLTACIDSGADTVGCHELRLDEIEQAVIPVRFPLDVNAALKDVVAHPQLFPTTLTKADTFKRIGGLSTTRKFGSDTEYLLRAYFFARFINIDRFLYIRRRRQGSLTTAPETALGSPVRVELGQIWRKDFEDIKNGRLALEDSSLALRHGAAVKIDVFNGNEDESHSMLESAANPLSVATGGR